VSFWIDMRRFSHGCQRHSFDKVELMHPSATVETEFSPILEPQDWQERRRAHQARVSTWTIPHKARAVRGKKHPVYDFLFSYYTYRPAWLLRWHPGHGVLLTGDGAEEFLTWRGYGATHHGVGLDHAYWASQRREFALWVRGLLTAMQTRQPFFSCFGVHEWAMVYQQTPDQIRHNAYPLRFSPQTIAQIVETSGACCTHFDAFRFFTPAARPLNRHQPTRKTTIDLEQRGCLHANMDLYKWAYKLSPCAASELVADCFALARDVREVDMRASPYDLRALGFEPIPVETAEGRSEYEQHQRIFAIRGEPLRARLVAACNWLLR
jgi:hypothetical protein